MHLHVPSPFLFVLSPSGHLQESFATSALLQQCWNDPWRKRNPPRCVHVLANAYKGKCLSADHAGLVFCQLILPSAACSFSIRFKRFCLLSPNNNNNYKFQLFIQVLMIYLMMMVNGFWLLVFVEFMWPFLFRTTTHLLSLESRRKWRPWRSWSAGLMVSHLPSICLTLHWWALEGL